MDPDQQSFEKQSAPIASSSSWILPPRLKARALLPDRLSRWTAPTETETEADPNPATSTTTSATATATATLGKAADPSRMGIFICLLDDRPHLHPTLPALHKHRLTAHGIPQPSDPTKDLPIHLQSSILSSLAPMPMKGGDHGATAIAYANANADTSIDKRTKPVGEAAIEGDTVMALDNSEPARQNAFTGGLKPKPEWVMWKFTEEEEARRKAYLPLS